MGPSQSAFIPRRLLVDSVTVVDGIIITWQRKGTRGFIWKVDFSKAYDSLDWKFLWVSMKRRGFLEEWIKWMRICGTT